MKLLKKIVSGTLGVSVLLINCLPIYGKTNTDQTLISNSMDTGLDSVNKTADIISGSLGSLTIENAEPAGSYEAEPEYIPVYTYTEPYEEVQDQTVSMTVDEFMALFGQQEAEQPLIEDVGGDGSLEQNAYDEALANYNAALADYEAASQMIETTKEVEVEIVEESADEEGNVTEVTRTEIQTVIEMVPAGDVDAAQAKLDAAKAALDNAQMALASARNDSSIAETSIKEVVEPAAINHPQEEQSLIDENVTVEETQTYSSSGQCGSNLFWTLNDDGLLTISGSGNMYNYSSSSSTNWGKDIKSVEIKSGATSIGNYAFYQCKSLSSVIIPDTVKVIGEEAFSNCIFTSISLPDSVQTIKYGAFWGCQKLTSIIMPARLTELGSCAFIWCTSLERIIIPSGVTTIPGAVFERGYKLKSVAIPNSVTSIESYAFNMCYELAEIYYYGTPDQWNNISISEQSRLSESVVIHCSVPVSGVNLDKHEAVIQTGQTLQLIATINPSTAMNKNVIWSSSDTNVATVSNGLVNALKAGSTTITAKTEDGHYTDSCTITVSQPVTGISLNQTTATINNGDSLQLYATISPADATNKKVTWSSSNTSVATVSSGLVEGLRSGTAVITVTTEDGNKRAQCTITVLDVKTGECGDNLYWRLSGRDLYIYGTGDMTDYTNTYGENPSPWGRSITSVKIDSDVTSIGSYAFSSCTSLTSITIPDNVTSIGSYAFAYSDNLTTIKLSNSITELSNGVFYECYSLNNVTIPDSVTKIGSSAFYKCNSLTSITIPNRVTSIDYYAFANCANLTNITLSNSIKSCYYNAFGGCTGLTDVYFYGTEEEWNEKQLYSFSDTVKIHFLDETLPFKDVYRNDWYYSVAKECYETGLINGTSDTTFSPMQEMTRAMVVTILWRMEGQPTVAFNNKFSDVKSTQWYAASVSWAVQAGVVHGYGDGTFKPDAAVTREQVAVMLANYAQYKGVYVPGTKKLNTYPDGSQVSTWAQAGMKWALTNGIISGNGEGYLRPKKSATRAEGAAMLLRMKNWL